MECLYETSTACSDLSPRGYQDMFATTYITPVLSRQNAIVPETVNFAPGNTKEQMIKQRNLALQRAFNLDNFDIDEDSINML